MDRTRTIFLNITRFNDDYGWSTEMEMHVVNSIIRDGNLERTHLILDDDNRICIPMCKEDHLKFIQSLFSTKEIWFSYSGFIELVPEDDYDYIVSNRNNSYAKQVLSYNNKANFFISTDSSNL